MKVRAYEVVERSVAFRRYIVFAHTAAEAKEQVRLGDNQPHYMNYHEDGINPVITQARRMPELDNEAPASSAVGGADGGAGRG